MKPIEKPTLSTPGISLHTISIVRDETAAVAPNPLPAQTHHILVVDCSGSMSDQLPLIRAQLRNKLPSLVRAGDFVSVVWFSGRNQAGCLAERVAVNSPADLSRLGKALDEWLKPMGSTAFVDPLREVLRICAAKTDAGMSLFFLTDGHDNQWKRSEILDALAPLRGVLSSATFVEYGWNCNRELLADMAAAAGGAHVFCEDFEAYDPVVSASLSCGVGKVRKVEIRVGEPLHGLVFSVAPEGPRSCSVEGGRVLVPEDVGAIHFFRRTAQAGSLSLAEVADPALLAPVCQGAALLAQKLKADDATALLAGLGDVRLFRLYQNAFGKQNLSDFQAAAVEASKGRLFEEGRKKDLKVDPDAFSLVQLLSLLARDTGNLFVPGALRYKRISRLTLDASEDLTAAEQAEITELTLKAKTSPELEALQVRVAAILAAKPKKLTFKPDENAACPVANLTWNETRANVSLLVKIPGTVELPPEAPAALPRPFPSFIWRNYAIIRDGIVNVSELPARLTQATFDQLKAKGVANGDWSADRVCQLDLRALPAVNRSAVRAVSAAELFALEYEMLKAKAAQKVFKAFEDRWAPPADRLVLEAKFGAEAAAWLAKQGFGESSGFAPKRKQAEATDNYVAIELEAKIEGLAPLPSFAAVEKKLVGGKPLSPKEALFKPAFDECVAWAGAAGSSNQAQLAAAAASRAAADARELARRLAAIKMGIIVGKAWPADLASMDNAKIALSFEGRTYSCELALREVEVKV